MQRHLIVLLILISGLNACATKPPDVLTSGPTMESVYEGSHEESEHNNLLKRASDFGYADIDDIDDYTRTSLNETEALFPKLDNPDLCMYVWPHQNRDGLIVPGYTTCFSMYEKTPYALPGER